MFSTKTSMISALKKPEFTACPRKALSLEYTKEESSPMTKLVTVIKGKGMDYVIDLRKGSPTYLQWESIELSEENALAVQIPAGFGHAFISLQKDTIQLYAVDRSGADAHSEHINYSDPQIGLKLPILVSEISDYDQNAPFVF